MQPRKLVRPGVSFGVKRGKIGHGGSNGVRVVVEIRGLL